MEDCKGFLGLCLKIEIDWFLRLIAFFGFRHSAAHFQRVALVQVADVLLERAQRVEEVRGFTLSWPKALRLEES
jgi:hypothetical protein